MSENNVDILLVEDNPSEVRLTMHAFQEQRIADRVQVVRDGAEALEYLFCTGPFAGRAIEDTPRLILLDIKLPLVDGVEVIRRIKSDSRTQMMPVVVLSSSREERDIVESYRLGANSYIVKPVNFDEFAQAIRQIGLYWLVLNQPPPLREATATGS
jgi:two-component system response regulator